MVFAGLRGDWTPSPLKNPHDKKQRQACEPSRGKRIPYSAPGDAGDDGFSSSVAPSFNTGGSRHQLNSPSRS